jgi:hypothetical protein
VGRFELFVEEHVEGVWGYCYGIVMKKMNVRLHELFLILFELQSDTDNATRSKSQHAVILKRLYFSSHIAALISSRLLLFCLQM